jgi:predicted metal-dependent HD superfamily phosphohydrolase
MDSTPTEVSTLPWPLPDALDLRDSLLAAYSDPARGYHDVRHLAEVLDRLDELADAGTTYDRTPVLLAAWFHDAVYESVHGSAGHSGDSNEERSAQLAESSLAGSSLEGAAVDVAEVARLVRLTATHRPSPGDHNGEVLCDADLAILAASADRHAEYVGGVRLEYADVPDEDFRVGRLAILESLAEKETLFHTEHARREWEPAARANLAAEIGRLRS